MSHRYHANQLSKEEHKSHRLCEIVRGESDVSDRLANTRRQQHDRQPIQCNASDAGYNNRHHHGRVER